MTAQIQQPSPQPFHPASLGKRILEGAGISLTLLFCFLFSAGEPDPQWGKFWVIKPISIVLLTGALSAAYYYSMDELRYQGGRKKIFANVSSLFVFIITLWLGTLLGLSGTVWD